ncbi:MAG: hypothetical protein ACYSX0_16570, partial [Planctomycetota bacterium]
AFEASGEATTLRERLSVRNLLIARSTLRTPPTIHAPSKHGIGKDNFESEGHLARAKKQLKVPQKSVTPFALSNEV